MSGQDRVALIEGRSTLACEEALALVAHDLRTSMMIIHGFAGTLSSHDRDLTESQRSIALEAISRHAEGLLAFSHDILTILEAEGGRLALTREPVDLREIAAAAVERISRDHPGRQFCLRAEDAHTIVSADRRRIGQVLDNLLGNAVKYSPSSVPIEVCVRRGADTVEVTVFDAGPPLPADVAVDPFTRVGPRPERGGGSGIGLSLCRVVVESLGGRIRAESGPGGVTFGFLLPVAG